MFLKVTLALLQERLSLNYLCVLVITLLSSSSSSSSSTDDSSDEEEDVVSTASRGGGGLGVGHLLPACWPVGDICCSSSGMGSTDAPSSSIEPLRPAGGRLPRGAEGSSMSSTVPEPGGGESLSDVSELALDSSWTEPELSRRNKPITDAIFGCSIPPVE